MKLGVQLTYTAWVSLHGHTPTAVPRPTNGFSTRNVLVPRATA